MGSTDGAHKPVSEMNADQFEDFLERNGGLASRPRREAGRMTPDDWKRPPGRTTKGFDDGEPGALAKSLAEGMGWVAPRSRPLDQKPPRVLLRPIGQRYASGVASTSSRSEQALRERLLMLNLFPGSIYAEYRESVQGWMASCEVWELVPSDYVRSAALEMGAGHPDPVQYCIELLFREAVRDLKRDGKAMLWNRVTLDEPHRSVCLEVWAERLVPAISAGAAGFVQSVTVAPASSGASYVGSVRWAGNGFSISADQTASFPTQSGGGGASSAAGCTFVVWPAKNTRWVQVRLPGGEMDIEEINRAFNDHVANALNPTEVSN